MKIHRIPHVAAVDHLNGWNDPIGRLLSRWLSLSNESRSKEFADTSRAAEIAGVSKRTVRDWIAAGHIRSVRIGKKHEILRESLIAYLKARADAWALKE
jgi:excisionase family DNA binding protein